MDITTTHMKNSFELFIVKELEDQIKYICDKIKNIEWSGILFYRYEGNIQDNSFRLIAEDLYLMNIGNAGSTEFEMTPEVITYMTENNLLDKQIGLIHSHHQMSAFFSDTDMNTLKKEGNERNNFLSLIVNNSGNYVANITEKIKHHSVIKDCTNTMFFDQPAIEDCNEYIEEYNEIRYYNLNIIKEREENMLETQQRINELRETKIGNDHNLPSLFDLPCPSDNDFKVINLMSKENYDKIKAITYQLLTGCVLINPDKIDIKKWLELMPALYKRRFKDKEDFEVWIEMYSDFLIFNSDLEEETVIEGVINELKKCPTNEYIDTIIKHFESLYVN